MANDITAKSPTSFEAGLFGVRSLTMTYFHGRAAHYHRRVGVSRSCSGWEGVVPPSDGRQAVKGWVAKPEGLGHRDSESRSTVLGCGCDRHGHRATQS